MRLYAHSGNAQDKSDWQDLPTHSLGVAELAAMFARSLDIGLERAA